MDLGLFCDSCQGTFDTQDKIPLIIACGHTVCKQCALQTQRDSYCKMCKKEQVIEDFSSLKINQKLFAVLNLQLKNQQRLSASSSDQPQQIKNGIQQQNQLNRPIYSFQSAHITNLPVHQQQQQQQNMNSSSQQNFMQQQVDLFNQIQSQTQQFKPPINQKSVKNESPIKTPNSIKNQSHSQIPMNQNEINNQNTIESQQIDQQFTKSFGNTMSSSKTYESQVESQKYNIHQDSGSNKKEDTVDQENDLKPASEFVINAPNLLQFGNQENIADNQQLSSLQLISQRQLETTQPSLSTQPQRQKPVKQFCKLHFDRVIEYFCQQCNFSVCSRCMFLHHNGHDLKQLEDALKNMKFKLQQFDAIVNETFKENSDTKTVLIDCKTSIEEMRQKQQEIIDIKFQELIRKIEERKTLISRDVLNRYDQSIFKLNDKIQMVEEQYDKLMQSQNYYSEVYNLLKDENFIKDEGSQIQIQMLEKVPDFDKFINENNLKIKTIQVALSKLKLCLIHKFIENAKIEYQEGTSIGLKPKEISLINSMSLVQTLQFDNYQQDLVNFNSLSQLPPKDNVLRQIKLAHQTSLNSSQQSQQPLKITSNQYSIKNKRF